MTTTLIQKVCNKPSVRVEFFWHGITRDRYMTSNWFKVADLEKQDIKERSEGSGIELIWWFVFLSTVFDLNFILFI